jgi:hypothetical protein
MTFWLYQDTRKRDLKTPVSLRRGIQQLNPNIRTAENGRWTELMVYRDIGGSAPVAYYKPTATKRVVLGAEPVPTAANRHLEPGMQVHGLKPVKESD